MFNLAKIGIEIEFGAMGWGMAAYAGSPDLAVGTFRLNPAPALAACQMISGGAVAGFALDVG